MRFERFRIVLVAAMFISILAFLLLNNQFHFIKDNKNFENRKLASMPPVDINYLDPFPASYQTYYNDWFSLRFRMVKAFNVYNNIIFKKSPCPNLVTIGNDGWLFLAGEEFNTYGGRDPLTVQELSDFKKELDYRNNYLAKRNCKFYVLIAPAKPNIYPEKVPFELARKKAGSNGEQLLAYLKQHSSVATVDVYSVLKEHKKNYQVYYALDNHWTQMGAFYASNRFLEQAAADFPVLKRLQLEDYTITKSDITTGNTVKILAADMDLYHDVNYTINSKQKSNVLKGKRQNYKAPEKFPYPWIYEEVSETRDTTRPKLLIISDSFGEYPFTLLSPEFKKTVKIWDNWEYKLNEPIVENEKPDLVLLIIHEKNLRYLLKHGSGLNK